MLALGTVLYPTPLSIISATLQAALLTWEEGWHLRFKAQQLFQQTAQHQCLVLDRCLGEGDGRADLCPGVWLASIQVLSRSLTSQGDTLVLSVNESWALSGKASCRPGWWVRHHA